MAQLLASSSKSFSLDDRFSFEQENNNSTAINIKKIFIVIIY